MSGFEHYGRELAAVDHEIAHWAAVCGIDPADRLRLEACRAAPHGAHPGDTPEETLRGLLMLRMKLETEMIDQGMRPPEFAAPTPG
jgi:hypothetical protein